MYSSRMRTARQLTVGGAYFWWGYILPAWDAYFQEVHTSGRCILLLGASRMGPLDAPPPPPPDRMTDACENISFPQLCLRTVKTVSPFLTNCFFIKMNTHEISLMIFKWIQCPSSANHESIKNT